MTADTVTDVAAEMLIIADDLSGAADCGIACTLAGLDTVVVLGETNIPTRAEAVSVDADTRRLSAEAATTEMARIVQARAHPGQVVFKKLDSTLRGNVGAELAAALQARRAMHGDLVAVVAPAFPATGRTTARGHQLLHGVKLEDTEVWRREEIEGVAHLPAMLEAAGLRACAIHLDVVRNPARLRAALATATAGHDAIVCDAETDADLGAIAAASVPLGRGTIWVGSAGLAHHLPEAAGLRRPRRPDALPPADGPILFVVGSMSRVSREQVERLAAAPGIELVTVPPADLRAGGGPWQGRLDAALATGRDVVALLDIETEVNLSEGLALCQALATLTAPLAERIGALVSTGGETARAVLSTFGADALRLVGELEPGVPLCVTADRRALPVITKAGAFGQPDTLLRCQAALRSGWGTNQAETS